jgi:hypothetical protein
MWEGLASDILAEPDETVAHSSLLDFLKTTALRRPPIAGKAADRLAETQLSFLATFADDTIRQQVNQIRTSQLPGLVSVTGAMAQLASLQQSQLVFMQTQVAAKSRVKSLTKYNANIASTIRAIARMQSDAQLPAYWRTQANLKATDYQQQLQRCCDTLAANKRWSPPVISHNLATEVAQGRIHSPRILNVTNA